MKRITRRGFIVGSAALSAAGRIGFSQAKDGGQLLLVGTQTSGTSKGIYAYSFVGGELKLIGLAAEADNPTFMALAPDGKTLLVANELDEYQGQKSGAVSTYSLDRTSARLAKISEEPSKGGGTCHVAFDHTGRAAFGANYGGGSAVSFAVGANGALSPAVSFFQFNGHGPDKERQEAPHAHRVTVSPDNRFLFVNDLGLDEIHIYRLDAATAKLAPNEPAAWKSAPGTGPRALQFHPNGRFVYCVTEMASSVVVLHWNSKAGTLETIQEIKMKPDDVSVVTNGDDIVIDSHGQFAYATDRFDDIIVTLSISATDGKLTLVDRTPCGGKVPRHLTLDPSGRWLLVANQESDTLSIFSRDAKTGKLANTGTTAPLSRPQCMVFA